MTTQLKLNVNETNLNDVKYLVKYLFVDMFSQPDVNKDNTEWEQWNVGSYDAFRSRKYANYGWWIGIKKNGRAKPGPKTRWGQKAIQFLAIRQD